MPCALGQEVFERLKRVGSSYSSSALTWTSGVPNEWNTTIGGTRGLRSRRVAYLWCDQRPSPRSRRSTGAPSIWTQQGF